MISKIGETPNEHTEKDNTMTKIYKGIWFLEIPQLVALHYSNGIVTTILQSSTSIKIQTLFIDIQQRRHEGQSKSIKIC